MGGSVLTGLQLLLGFAAIVLRDLEPFTALSEAQFKKKESGGGSVG